MPASWKTKEKQMNNRYYADFWPKKVTRKVQYLREMINNTKTENKAKLLAVTRSRLTEALAQNYDQESPQSTIEWVKQVREQVKNAVSDLEFLIRVADRPLLDTVNVYGCAINLTAELGRIIRKIEKHKEKGGVMCIK